MNLTMKMPDSKAPVAGILFLKSPLHDRARTAQAEESIFSECSRIFACKVIDESSISSCDYLVVPVLTGGTENQFLKLWPVIAAAGKPFVLAATETDNSLPASLEILTWLNQNHPGSGAGIVHGEPAVLAAKIDELLGIYSANELVRRQVGGIIGAPSEWLIASMPELKTIEQKLGMKFVNISMNEFKDMAEKADASALSFFAQTFYRAADRTSTSELARAAKIYGGLVRAVKKYGLSALTLRCFDILASDQTTGCLALARLNDDGIPAACEGDVPAMLTMMIARIIAGKASFMANPSRIDGNTVTLAHCTCPTSLVRQFTLNSHFESGIGLAIAGEFAPGPFTLLKLDISGGRYALASGRLVPHEYSPKLCRTQIRLEFTGAEDYFLHKPLGNHHLIIPGDCTAKIRSWCEFMQMQPVWQ